MTTEEKKLPTINAHRSCNDNCNTVVLKNHSTIECFEGKRCRRNKYSPKKINDLLTLINSLKIDNHPVILLIDANESICSNSGEIATLLEKIKTIDPITNIYGSIDGPNTYKRDFTRIYFIFCTVGISRFIVRNGILPFDYRTTLDHRGVYIDIQLTLYLQDAMYLISDISSRLLSTSKYQDASVSKRHLFNIYSIIILLKIEHGTTKY